MRAPNFFVKAWGNRWARSFLLGFILTVALYVMVFNYTEPTDLGIARNFITGEMWPQDGGWHLSPPWVRATVIDTRPMRVTVPSAGRGFNAKLVQFEASKWREFVETEGFRYYWWANRLSFNSGYDEEYRGVRDIMRGYAYSKKSYSFIKILNEYQ